MLHSSTTSPPELVRTIPAAPVGPARASHSKRERDPGGHSRTSQSRIAPARTAQMRHDRVGALHPPAHRPRCWCPASRRREALAHPRPIPALDRGAQKVAETQTMATRYPSAPRLPAGRSRTCPQPLNAWEPQPSTPCRGASLSALARGSGRGRGSRRSRYSLISTSGREPLRASPVAGPGSGPGPPFLLFIATLSGVAGLV